MKRNTVDNGGRQTSEMLAVRAAVLCGVRGKNAAATPLWLSRRVVEALACKFNARGEAGRSQSAVALRLPAHSIWQHRIRFWSAGAKRSGDPAMAVPSSGRGACL
jgi:hypothetical protein